MNDDASSSKVSVSFPTFNEPSGTTVESEQRDRPGPKPEVYDLGICNASPAADLKEDPGERTSDSVNDGEGGWDSKGDLAESDIAEEYVINEMESSSRPRSRAFSTMTGLPYRRSRPPPPNLAPAIWRIILFQV